MHNNYMYVRCLSVIRSCKTVAQRATAFAYLCLAYRSERITCAEFDILSCHIKGQTNA